MSKAPDFARHEQVQPEQVTEHKILFKITEDTFDKAYRESNGTIEDKPLWIDLYMKVGLFCGWSWEDFKNTPYAVIKYINTEIDSRLKKATFKGNFLTWDQLSIQIALARAFSPETHSE